MKLCYVSIVQTYILQLKRAKPFFMARLSWVSIVQTYILQLKRRYSAFREPAVQVSIVQTYILQLKLFTCGLLEKKRFNCANLHP